MYMFKILFFNGFQKWSKLPKYLWNTPQTSLCIHRQLRTTKLPMNDDAYVYFFLFFNDFQKGENYQNTSEKSSNKYKQIKSFKNY